MKDAYGNRERAIRMRMAGQSVGFISHPPGRSACWFQKGWAWYLEFGADGLLDVTHATHQVAGRIPPELEHMFLAIWRRRPDRKLVFVAGSSYTSLDLLWSMIRMRNLIRMTVRFRTDAALFAPALERKPGTNGRPRSCGQRVPKLTEVASEPATVWQPQRVACWYGERDRRIELTMGTAVWSNSGQPVVAIRSVIVRDPLGRFKTQALLCADRAVRP